MVLTEIPRKHVEKFCYYFKRTRQHKQITQNKLAELMGYSNGQFVSNIERGLSLVPVTDIPKICFYLDTDPNEMYWVFINSRTSAYLEKFLRAKAKLTNDISRNEKKAAKYRAQLARLADERRKRILAESTGRREIFLRDYISFDEYLASIPRDGPDGFMIREPRGDNEGRFTQPGDRRTDIYEDVYEILGREAPFKESD